jgi:enhancer of yellow 2 transcription factor
MATIKWDSLSDGDLRAEVEAALESQGEAQRIRTFLAQSPAVEDWRQEMRKLCRQLIAEVGVDNLTFNILYDHIAAQAHELFPAVLSEEVRQQLIAFLQVQFEDDF